MRQPQSRDDPRAWCDNIAGPSTFAIVKAAFPDADGAGFQSELEPHRGAYEELNRQATVTRHEMYLQESPQGDLAITIMEADGPSRVLRAFVDTPYDLWWRAWNKDVHGFDPADIRPEDFHPGGLVFTSREPAHA